MTDLPFGLLLKEARLAKGLTQFALAWQLGVSGRRIGTWEQQLTWSRIFENDFSLFEQLEHILDVEKGMLRDAYLNSTAPIWMRSEDRITFSKRLFPVCFVEGCTKRRHQGIYCAGHQSRLRKRGNLQEEIPLAVRKKSGASRNDLCGKGHSLADAYIKKNGNLRCRTCHLSYYNKKGRPKPSAKKKIGKFGTALRTARTSKEMTQVQLAQALGIHYRAISKWENGAHSWYLDSDQFLHRLEQVLDVPKGKLKEACLASFEPRIMLNYETAEIIRELHTNGASCRELSQQFGTTSENIYSIVKGKTWKKPLDRVDSIENGIRQSELN